MYIGAMAQRQHQLSAKKELHRKPIALGTLDPDEFEIKLREVVQSMSLDEQFREAEEKFDLFSEKFHCLAHEDRERIFSVVELNTITDAATAHLDSKRELKFLQFCLLGNERPHTNEAKLAHQISSFGLGFSLVQWQQYHQAVHHAALRRRLELMAKLVDALLSVNALFELKSQNSPELRLELKKHAALQADIDGVSALIGRVKHRDLGKALPLGRPHREPLQGKKAPPEEGSSPNPSRGGLLLPPVASPSPTSPSSARHDASSGSSEDNAASGGESPTEPQLTLGEKPSSSASEPKKKKKLFHRQQEKERLLAYLPEYLRHHYDD